jgi:hypothetical protein
MQQSFFEKIVEKDYYKAKSSKGKSLIGASYTDSSVITSAVEKIDYKDFGHYVEDCKKHLTLAKSL